MSKKQKIVGIAILSVIAIFLTVQLSYSFFGRTRTGEKESTFASSCFNITLDVENEIQKNGIPMKDEDSDKLTPTIFTIKNTCKISAEVGINLDVLKTTVGDLSHFKISLKGDVNVTPTIVEALETTDSQNDDTLITKKLISIYVRGNSEKKIELRTWLVDTLQNGEGHDHVLETKLVLSADAVPEELSPAAEKIIADNGGLFKIRSKDVDLKVTSPMLLYGETILEDTLKRTVLAGKQIAFSNQYERDEKTGTYQLINPVNDVLSEDKINWYTCLNTVKSCSSLYKIKEVDINANKENYTISNPVEKTLTALARSTLSGNKTFGKSFHIDQTTGKFVLDEIVQNATYTEEYIGYYVCGTSTTIIPPTTNPTSCTYLHKIKTVQTDPGEGKYYSKETLNTTVTFDSSSDKTVATSFEFDNETGNYTLINPIDSVTYSTDYINYYTCNTSESECTTLYKINETTDGVITNADKLVRTTRYHRAKKSDSYTLTKNNSYITLSDRYSKSNEVVGYNKEDSGIYMSEDDLGNTYYYRGGNDNNNIYFAGYYWNLVRINGDGTLRMIYRGTSPDATGEDATIGTSEFNKYAYENRGVGYMFGEYQAKNYYYEHKNVNESTVKIFLETWYEENLLSHKNYIADTTFCNDRSLYSGSGISNEATYYKPYYRIRFSNNLIPTLKCQQINDRFTVNNKEGNRNNKYPIGLITADELVYGGIKSNLENIYNYLNTGINYWTMSAGYANRTNGTNTYMNTSSTSGMSVAKIETSMGVRPVINLEGNVILSGKGTLENPYVVKGFANEEVTQ